MTDTVKQELKITTVIRVLGGCCTEQTEHPRCRPGTNTKSHWQRRQCTSARANAPYAGAEDTISNQHKLTQKKHPPYMHMAIWPNQASQRNELAGL